MKDQPDQNGDVTAPAPEAESTEAPDNRRRLGRAFAFLGSWTFWWRLGVGMLILGAGVLIGLGIAWFIEDEREGHGNGREGNNFTFEVVPSEMWSGEGRLSKDGSRFRLIPIPDEGLGWKGNDDKEWMERKELPGRDFGDPNGIYIPYELLEELIDRVADRIEGLIDRVESHRDERRFDPRGRWGDWFSERGRGPWEDGKSWWNDQGGYEEPGDDGWSKDSDKSEDPADDWWGGTENGAGGPLGGFGFPFGEFLPGLAFLEDCELDFEDLFGMMEDLEGLEEEGLEEGAESLEGLFEEVEEFLEQACETPAEN